MKLLYALFFGAGVAGIAYTRLGRRVGYGNQENVWLIVGVVFILVTAFFYTVLAFLISSS
ncbi:MAG TPA: hypothetical protein VHA37_09615 [Candidatus Saccharimonadales bacterium]|nr:hypothetical protein [Candidatus Saccharimonadales bacterium]